VKPIWKWAAAIAASCVTTVMVHPRLARSADHLDAPAVRTDPTGDLGDLYAWMEDARAVFVMTVHPAAPPGTLFSDAVQYVFHTSSSESFGSTPTETSIICTFDAAQKIECWVGKDEYLTGDASQTGGLTSASGKVRVFAGLRADPFFFNLDGFRVAVSGANPVLYSGYVQRDSAGCPQLPTEATSYFVNALKTTDGGPPQDFFQSLNALAIVVSVDKSLVTRGGSVVSVWASTNRKP
jgi:hypothetical protein